MLAHSIGTNRSSLVPTRETSPSSTSAYDGNDGGRFLEYEHVQEYSTDGPTPSHHSFASESIEVYHDGMGLLRPYPYSAYDMHNTCRNTNDAWAPAVEWTDRAVRDDFRCLGRSKENE